MEKFPHLRATICDKLISTLPEIKSGKVFRGILWILGEYVEATSDINATIREIRKVLGEVPILASEQRLLDEAGGEEEAEEEKPKTEGGGRPKVLADGTYATETAYTSTSAARLEAVKTAAKPPLRSAFVFHLVSSSVIISWFHSIDPWRRLLYRCCAGRCSDKAGPPFLRSLERCRFN